MRQHPQFPLGPRSKWGFAARDQSPWAVFFESFFEKGCLAGLLAAPSAQAEVQEQVLEFAAEPRKSLRPSQVLQANTEREEPDSDRRFRRPPQQRPRVPHFLRRGLSRRLSDSANS